LVLCRSEYWLVYLLVKKDSKMPKATQNFAYNGKTYFVDDEVPAEVAAAVGDAYTEKLEAKKTPKDTSEGE
jgi:hypothetical protein